MADVDTFDYGANSVTYCGHNNEDELKKYSQSAMGDHLEQCNANEHCPR